MKNNTRLLLFLVAILATYSLHSAEWGFWGHPAREIRITDSLSISADPEKQIPAVYTMQEVQKIARFNDCFERELRIAKPNLEAMLKRKLKPTDRLVRVYICERNDFSCANLPSFIPLDVAQQGKEYGSINLIHSKALRDFQCRQIPDPKHYYRDDRYTPWETTLARHVILLEKRQLFNARTQARRSSIDCAISHIAPAVATSSSLRRTQSETNLASKVVVQKTLDEKKA